MTEIDKTEELNEDGTPKKHPIVIDLQLGVPLAHPNNIYEIVGALPHNLSQVFPN